MRRGWVICLGSGWIFESRNEQHAQKATVGLT